MYIYYKVCVYIVARVTFEKIVHQKHFILPLFTDPCIICIAQKGIWKDSLTVFIQEMEVMGSKYIILKMFWNQREKVIQVWNIKVSNYLMFDCFLRLTVLNFI